MVTKREGALMTKYYDGAHNIYRNRKVVIDNIGYFQTWFLEAIYKFYANQKEFVQNEDIKDSVPPSAYKEKRQAILNRKEKIRQEAEELYKILYSIRYTTFKLYQESPGHKKAFDEECKKNFILWINLFVWTYDPRLNAFGLPPNIPLVLTPKQESILKNAEDSFQNNMDIMVEKSRAEGLTEIMSAWDVHKWLFEYGYKSGWGSRKEELVDKLGDPDTLFARLRRIIYGLPKKMLPTGYGRKNNKYDNRLRIVNPDNGAVIAGEGGVNIGRGGRTSNYKLDEYAFLENPKSVDEALSYNTNCRILFSTPNGMNKFYDHKMSGRIKVETAGWWNNPSKNDKWYENKRNEDSEWYQLQKMTFDPVIIAQEVDIDYNASVEDVLIPSKWVQAAVDFDLPEGDYKAGGFDLAAGGQDIATYVSRKGVVIKNIEKCNGVTPVDTTWEAAEKAERDDLNELRYDQNAIGEDVYPVLTKGDRVINFELYGEYGQGKASEEKVEGEKLLGNEKFRNRRAELWWNLRVRFRKTYEHKNKIRFYSTAEMIAIPNHTSLITELSSPKLMYTASGKIGVESKKEMKRRNIKSPNYADSVAYCFGGTVNEVGLPVVARNNKKDFLKSTEFDINLNGLCYHYLYVYQTDEAELYAVLVQYDMGVGMVSVIKEIYVPEISPGFIRDEIRKFAQTEMFSVDEWVGNDKIYEGLEKGGQATWYEFRKQGIKIKQNYFSNYAGSLSLINKMFRDGFLRVHEDCEKTVDQLRNWHMKGGKPAPGFKYAEALLNLMTFLKRKKKVRGDENEMVHTYK